MRILAIETSCDETGLALLSGKPGVLQLEKNIVYSQAELHKQYGGVVPEVAARKHVETMIPVLDSLVGDKKLSGIDYLAVTGGPGLITSLLLGVATAKTLAHLSGVPLLSINHIEGHVYSNWLSNAELVKHDKRLFPSLILIVSGGHTELVLMSGHGKYKLIGQTLDDAVGEAFDKVAKLLNLGYPGGPAVSKLAKLGRADAFDLPRPMLTSPNFDFSFAGLKTAVLYALERKKQVSQSDMEDICASFQAAVTEVLLAKTFKAAEKYRVKSVAMAGGVAANDQLRLVLSARAKKIGLPFFYPDKQFTGDNAAMIAAAAYYQVASRQAKKLSGKKLLTLQPNSNWQLV